MIVPQTALMRFLYLGNVELVHVCSNRDPTPETVMALFECVNRMSADLPVYPFSVIKRVMEGDLMMRNTECIIALAYCVRCVDNDELRAIVYDNVHVLLHSDTDLFRFVYWATELKSNAINSHPNQPAVRGRHGFGRGFRRAVAKWYETRTAEQFVELVGLHRGQFGWTHCDLLSLCHVKFEPNDERVRIIEALHTRGVNFVSQLNATGANRFGEKTIVLERLERFCNFKVCERAEVAVQMFRDGQFEFGHVPSHLLKNTQFWNAVLGDNVNDAGGNKMPIRYADFLQLFRTFSDHRLMQTSADTKAVMMKRLTDVAAVNDASLVQPLTLLSMRNSYARGMRPTEKVKAKFYREWRTKKFATDLAGDPDIVDSFTVAINQSFNNVPVRTSTAEFVVAVDLRAGATRRKVFNMEHLNCFEAMVCLALSIVKRGPTSVLSFSDDVSTMHTVLLERSDDYESAYQKCKDLGVGRTKQSLKSSIVTTAEAGTGKEYVFVTIMDSAARIIRQGLRQFEEFEKYRKIHPNSRYILINLGRHKRDLHSYPGKGVLEICGLTPNVFSIINAFTTNKFN